MDVRLALAGVLIAGYAGYKGFERSGGKLPFSLSAGRRRARSLSARKPPAPDKLAFERVTLDATPANLQSFIRLTGNLERLGFRIVADYAIAGWPDLYCRGLIHHDKPVHAVIVERMGSPAHVELFTLCDDLSALVTSGSEESDDPSKPAALRFQQIPGLSLDELFVQHLSSLENLYQDQLSPMPATRLAFFEHQRALLVIEHELRKAKRMLRTDSLSRVIDALPELPTQELLKRYGFEEPAEEAPEAEAVTMVKAVAASQKVEAKPEPEEAPKRWGIGSSLLSKRLAARDEAEEAPSETSSDSGRTLVLEPEAMAPLPFEVIPEEPASLPFEVVPEPDVTEAAALESPDPIEATEPRALLPFEIVPVEEASDPEPLELSPVEEPVVETISAEVPPAEPSIKLPFEIFPEAPAAPSSKPTCPHCGATLFSSLSSRCSKCKQAVR